MTRQGLANERFVRVAPKLRNSRFSDVNGENAIVRFVLGVGDPSTRGKMEQGILGFAHLFGVAINAQINLRENPGFWMKRENAGSDDGSGRAAGLASPPGGPLRPSPFFGW